MDKLLAYRTYQTQIRERKRDFSLESLHVQPRRDRERKVFSLKRNFNYESH